jgi:undecaprenyl phosphate N,N'-diacetylbacillosamine 1-phosphate transferase
MIYRNFGKRLLDLFISVFLFILLLPVFLFLFVILGIHYFENPFFAQSRPGQDAKIFKILKFKTMRDLYDENGNPLPDENRISTLGKWIRKSSLDEIPQLINVIKGDMSLVGPRPLLVEYLTIYSPDQARRHSVKPGVTGWAQVNGRNAITWEEKFEFDLWYVQNFSLMVDIKILGRTFENVVKGKGVTQKGHVTMGKFKGSDI